jgi:eukaryotic-like serine/threonine-protein kinase
VRFWRSRTGTKLSETSKQDSPISAVVFSTDGSSLLTAYLSGLVLQWSVPDGTPLGKPIKHPEYIDAIALAPSGKEIATGCRDDFLRFWDPQTGNPTRHDIRHNNPVVSITYHPDGKTIATGCADYSARIWSLETGEQLGSALLLKGPVTSVRYIANGRALLAASIQDEEVNCYDPASGTTFFPGLPHATGVVSVSSNSDASEIVTVTADGTARLWRIPSASVPPPNWLGDYLRAVGGLSFSAEQQLTQVPTAERLRLRQKLLENVRDSSVWEKVMRRSFQTDIADATESRSR